MEIELLNYYYHVRGISHFRQITASSLGHRFTLHPVSSPNDELFYLPYSYPTFSSRSLQEFDTQQFC